MLRLGGAEAKATRKTVRFEVFIGDDDEPRYIADTHDEAADWFQAYEERNIKAFGYDFGGDVYIREVRR